MNCEVPIPVYEDWYILLAPIIIYTMIGANNIYQSDHFFFFGMKSDHNN